MILDATAGNRHIWGKNKHPEGVIFFDKEVNLKIPADVIGTWDKLPFPDNSFDCIIFDPPHTMNDVMNWKESSRALHFDPQEKAGGSWWSFFKNKQSYRTQILKGQREFARISPRMCLKWNDCDITIELVLSLFTEWNEVIRYSHTSKSGISKSKTWWVKLVRKNVVD
jgi:hypothetical protein